MLPYILLRLKREDHADSQTSCNQITANIFDRINRIYRMAALPSYRSCLPDIAIPRSGCEVGLIPSKFSVAIGLKISLSAQK
jgi:hypothetical protein